MDGGVDQVIMLGCVVGMAGRVTVKDRFSVAHDKAGLTALVARPAGQRPESGGPRASGTALFRSPQRPVRSRSRYSPRTRWIRHGACHVVTACTSAAVRRAWRAAHRSELSSDRPSRQRSPAGPLRRASAVSPLRRRGTRAASPSPHGPARPPLQGRAGTPTAPPHPQRGACAAAAHTPARAAADRTRSRRGGNARNHSDGNARNHTTRSSSSFPFAAL